MGLWIRRAALVAISLVLGCIITYAEVNSGLSIFGVQIGLDTSLADYGWHYVFFTVGALAIGIGIWLDKFMKTELLPH